MPASLWNRGIRQSFWAISGALVIGLGLTGSHSSLSLIAQAQENEVNLTLVSFAVTKAAYDRIIPKFVEDWKQKTGQQVTIDTSYGGSGSQARAVIDGLEADVVALALALDTQRIEEAGLIDEGWEEEVPYGGIITRSVAVIVTRDGNPQGIQDWADLAKPEIRVVTANPKTSGGARWNFLGLWGSVTQTGGDDAQAQEFVTQVYQNVPILPRDAREATDIFVKKNQGDALINYENEVLLAELNGDKLTYVVPKVNISIDNPIAVVDAVVDKKGTREVAEAFVNYLYTPEVQRIFASVGFRPVDEKELEGFQNKFAPVETLFTVEDLQGWDVIQEKFFDDGAIFDQIQKQL
ncbi:MAG: sulfate ABC transporter substrate-binding protein [Cyanobacteriota bacterium]|nr:sulfate ABC transporter substrate-binding protein [Cyanobacteriota bacterium]